MNIEQRLAAAEQRAGTIGVRGEQVMVVSDDELGILQALSQRPDLAPADRGALAAVVSRAWPADRAMLVQIKYTEGRIQ